MKAEYLNAFIEATEETFDQMCGIKFFRRGPVMKVNGEIVDSDELMGILGLSGGVRGAVMISAPLETGMKIVSRFMMEEITTINCDLMDAIGELVNILAGAADAKIDDFHIDLALPSVLVGSHSKFFAKAGNPFIIVPCRIKDMGNFNLGVSLEVLKEKH